MHIKMPSLGMAFFVGVAATCVANVVEIFHTLELFPK